MKRIGKYRARWLLFLFLIPLFLPQTTQAQDVKISASVDRNPVAVNEQFQYTVEVSGPMQNLPDVKLPDLSKFAVLSGPNVSSSFQIVNFSMSASRKYSLVLMPRQEGTFKISPASVKYKGKNILSNSVDLTVTKQTRGQQPKITPPGTSRRQSARPNVDLSKSIFLKAIPSRRKVFQNEEVTIRYKLYFRQRITNTEFSKLPEAAGCWVEEYPVSQRPPVSTEVINGVRYNVAELRKIAVFPSHPGKISVSPLTLKIETLAPRRRSRDLFDDFFSDPFGQTVTVPLNSGTVGITVLPLPAAGKPANFSGLVGDFKINSSVDKNTLKTNEAISYKINISGKGTLKFLNKLPVEFSPNFEVYEPKISESVNKSGAAISSKKDFEYVLIPRVAGNQKIAGFSLSYFNPQDNQYHLLKVPDFDLQVSPGENIATGAVSGALLSREEVKLLGKDIRFIKENVPRFSPIGKMPYQNWWFVLAFVVPLVFLGISWGYRNHLEKMSTNIQYARSRRAHQLARGRLKEAHSYLKQGKAAEFYSAISKALMGYVADKTNRSSAGLVSNEIKEILEKYQVESALQQDFMSCLEKADFNRFAPGTGSSEEMNSFYKVAEKILIGLQKYF